MLTASKHATRSGRLWPLCWMVCGLGLGYLAGIAASPSSTVVADVTEEPRREAFKAGGVLNEPILREIAATLKRMETRLEHIEKNTTPPQAAKAQK